MYDGRRATRGERTTTEVGVTDGDGSVRTASSQPTPVTLHDVLVARQNGKPTARQAMARSDIDTVGELS